MSNLSGPTASFSRLREGKNLVSFSTTTTLLAPAFRRDRVIPPGPGPTSTTHLSLTREWAAIESRIRGSRIKFWDRDFLALMLYILKMSPTEGRGGSLRWAIVLEFLTIVFNMLITFVFCSLTQLDMSCHFS